MNHRLIIIILVLLLVLDSMHAVYNPAWAADQKSLAAAAFSNPHPVAIKGLPIGADNTPISTEEPFVSRDGRFLFFNTSDKENNKDLHFAQRIKNQWVYRGALGPDVNTAEFVEANPTMDRNNDFFYIDTAVERMVRTARFSPETGKIAERKEFFNIPTRKSDPAAGQFEGNMGVEISADGQTIFFSRAVWEMPAMRMGRVISADILFLDKKDNAYSYDRMKARKIMQNVNTADLEYAASISSDGLELFFTRLSRDYLKNGKPKSMIMHAVRNSLSEPFGPPRMIQSIGSADFVEGPAITDDGKELYYHKYNGNKFRLFKVIRYNQ